MTLQYDAYKETAINTSDNVRIVSLLLDGAINFMLAARGKMEQNDITGKGLYLGKATAIVSELLKSLNIEEGGEVAANLRRLYDFILDRLLTANRKSDINSLHEAERVLENIRIGWKEMERGRFASHSSSAHASMNEGMAVRA